jgi:SAM-dependent methyltransferase
MSWFKHWFADELYMLLYAHRDADEARQAIDLFQRSTSLSPESGPLLDLACGTGRHAFELARRGYRVIAADLSPTLLANAQRKTRRFTSTLHLVRADMRHLPLSGSVAGVLQLFTAFGYFATDAENISVLRQVRSSLTDRGWYMLDFLNAAEVQRSIQPYSVTEIDGATIEQERRIENGRVEKRILIRSSGREREFRESVRLFTLEDFRCMFEQCGLMLERVFGDYSGGPHSETSPRCIMFARAR